MADTGAYAFEGVDSDKLHEVHQTFTGYLFGALGQNPRWSQSLQLANDLPTKGNTAKAKMASRAYGVHEWVDERHKAKIRHYDHTVEVKRWANALTLQYDDLEDEGMNLGQYKMLINEMGDDFVEHRHSLFTDLISAGFAATLGTCYDGQFFFDTDHPLDDGSTQSNKGTAALAENSFYAAIKAMEDMKKSNGLIANIMPTHLIVPSALRQTAEGILDKEENANGSDNLLYKRTGLIVDPRLDSSSATAWFLLDGSKALKPFFSADRQPVRTAMDTGNLFEEGSINWGGNARYNASYGFYQVMYGSDGTS